MARGKQTEPCRVRGCPKKRSKTELVCKDHWFELPKAIRDQIWTEYQKMPGSTEHLRVCAAALKSLLPFQGALLL